MTRGGRPKCSKQEIANVSETKQTRLDDPYWSTDKRIATENFFPLSDGTAAAAAALEPTLTIVDMPVSLRSRSAQVKVSDCLILNMVV